MDDPNLEQRRKGHTNKESSSREGIVFVISNYFVSMVCRPVLMASSTDCLRVEMTVGYFSTAFLKIAVPATITLAPDLAAVATVSGDTPPST